MALAESPVMAMVTASVIFPAKYGRNMEHSAVRMRKKMPSIRRLVWPLLSWMMRLKSCFMLRSARPVAARSLDPSTSSPSMGRGASISAAVCFSDWVRSVAVESTSGISTFGSSTAIELESTSSSPSDLSPALLALMAGTRADKCGGRR